MWAITSNGEARRKQWHRKRRRRNSEKKSNEKACGSGAALNHQAKRAAAASLEMGESSALAQHLYWRNTDADAEISI